MWIRRRQRPILLLAIIVVMATAIVFRARFDWLFSTEENSLLANVKTLDRHSEAALEAKDMFHPLPVIGQSHTTQNRILVPVTLDLKNDALGNNDKLHLVVMFYNLLDPDWRAKHFSYNNESWDARMREISDCIKHNLNNSMVATVHYLYHNVTTMNTYLDSLDLPHREKLFVHEINATTVGDFMRFASDNLQGRVVMVLNSDGFLGEGFDKIDVPYMRKTRVAYALTRHWVACKGGASCHDGDSYIGSHDGYILFVGEKLPEPFLVELNHSPSHWGIESIVIGALHHTLKYTVLNPCKILKLMHHHCSGVRPGRSLSLRLSGGPHNSLAPFSGLYTR